MLRLFFEPRANGVAGDAEGARQSAQGTAFFIGPQDFLALFLRIAGRLRIVAAATLAIFTVIALFAIASQPVAKQVVTAAITTSNRNCNHKVSLPFLPLLSHYR